MKILGLTGPMGAGKDTLANFLLPRYSVARVSFGDLVKDLCARLYDIPLHLFHDPIAKNLGHPNLPEGFTLRDLMQRFGTEVCRHIDPDVWLSAVSRQLDTLEATGIKLAVITDVRFLNESHLLEARGAQLIYLYEPSAHLAVTAKVASGDCHRSEAQAVEFSKEFPHFKNLYKDHTPQYEQEVKKLLDLLGVTP